MAVNQRRGVLAAVCDGLRLVCVACQYFITRARASCACECYAVCVSSSVRNCGTFHSRHTTNDAVIKLIVLVCALLALIANAGNLGASN